MGRNGLREVWESKQCALNAWLSIGSSYSAEIIANLPYDSVTVDLQHGMFDFDVAVTMLQAISTTSAVPMARVAWNRPWLVQKVLDAGAQGVICPMIETAEDCEAFVRSVNYPPRGERSFGPARGILTGGANYVATAGDTIMSWAMVETERSVRNIEAIVKVPGLSGIYIGPSDLAMSVEGAVRHPPSGEVARYIDLVIGVSKRAGVRVGIFCADVSFAKEMREKGCDLITVMNDAGLIRTATASLIGELGQHEGRL